MANIFSQFSSMAKVKSVKIFNDKFKARELKSSYSSYKSQTLKYSLSFQETLAIKSLGIISNTPTKIHNQQTLKIMAKTLFKGGKFFLTKLMTILIGGISNSP